MSQIFRGASIRGHPELSVLPFDLISRTRAIQTEFPTLGARRISVWLQQQRGLACVQYVDDSAAICIHAVLNHPQTPAVVVDFILRHEMLHLVVPPREVEGRSTSHPPEFWEAEQRFPHREATWRWIWWVLGSCLKRDKQKECTFVKSSWKRLMSGERPSVEKIEELRAGEAPIGPDDAIL